METPPEPSSKPVPNVSPSLRTQFRRGDQWQPARVRHLSATTIAVATTSPPRKGDFLEMRLAVDDVETYLWSEVLAVTPPDAGERLGAAGFSARFVSPGTRAEQELQRIVARVGNAGVVADHTPARAAERYPVRWPVDVGWSTGSSRYTALDLSLSGLFIASHAPLPVHTHVAVSVPLDRGDSDVHLDGRVARVFDRAAASNKELRPGFGIEVTISGVDGQSFQRFVQRISRRNSFHIVVAAERRRLAATVDELTSIGYATSGADRLDTLIDKAFARSQGPDAVLIDASFESAFPETIEALQKAVKLRPTQLVRVDCSHPGAAQAYADRTFGVP